jgi:D-3-phosphoglycerate dehydrogenase
MFAAKLANMYERCPMTRTRVLLTDNDLGDREWEVSLLEEHLEADVIVADCVTAADVLAEVRRHDPHAIITQWAPVTADVMDAATSCRVISRVGIGVDMIDVAAARQRGIEVRNVPHYCTEEVATHAVAMALAMWRRLPQFDAAVRAGIWDAASHAPEIGRLSEATVGLIGCGRIGGLVGRAFEAWGAEVIVVDPMPGEDGYARVSLQELAARADIISLHAPLLESTRHMVDASFLAALERRPVLVNASRGGLVDADAAVAAVQRGALRGLALDVFEDEPLPDGHPLRSAPDTLLAPHAAWCSAQALPDLRRGAIMNVVDAAMDGRLDTNAKE